MCLETFPHELEWCDLQPSSPALHPKSSSSSSHACKHHFGVLFTQGERISLEVRYQEIVGLKVVVGLFFSGSLMILAPYPKVCIMPTFLFFFDLALLADMQAQEPDPGT